MSRAPTELETSPPQEGEALGLAILEGRKQHGGQALRQSRNTTAPPRERAVVREDKLGDALPESYGFAGLAAAGVLAGVVAEWAVLAPPVAAGADVPAATGFAASYRFTISSVISSSLAA